MATNMRACVMFCNARPSERSLAEPVRALRLLRVAGAIEVTTHALRTRADDMASHSHRERCVHELALMEGMVDAVIDRVGDERIAAVRLAIGTLAGVDIEALRFCFEVCAKDTTLAGATLEIRSIDARARCRSCGVEHAPRSFASPCSCGSFDRELLAGDELRLEEVEIY